MMKLFEYAAEDGYEEPYHDMVSSGESEDDQSFKFGDGSVLGDILEAPVPPPMQFRDVALELSIPPLRSLTCVAQKLKNPTQIAMMNHMNLRMKTW